MKTCENCRYFFQRDKDSTFGKCILNPPIPLGWGDGPIVSVDPTVKKNRPACRFFKPKDIKQEVQNEKV